MTRKIQQSNPTKKIHVLAYCDSPTCATGFGTVSRNIFEGLYRTGRYQIDILGINYWGDPHPFPYRIWPTGVNPDRDPYGRRKVANMIVQMQYDLLFFLQDSFILDFLPELHAYLAKQGRKFRSICYYPIDGIPKEQWIRNVCACDYVYTYTHFGKEQSEKIWPGAVAKNIGVIPHGVNTSDYYVLPKNDVSAFRKQYFGALADKFIFMNLNRNQIRKDIPRSIRAFVEFRKQVPDAVLYLHMMKEDQGWNLPEVCRGYGLDITKDVIFPENFGANQGYPRQVVNMLYNAVDCVISTAVGEGWGLCLDQNTYVHTNRGSLPISKLTTHDKIIFGGRDYQIRGIVSSSKKEAYKVILSNNKELIGSYEHKILTSTRGYVPLGEITVDDFLVLDKAVLREENAVYTYDLREYADLYNECHVWNKMSFSSLAPNSMSKVMAATQETKKIVETAVRVYLDGKVVNSPRVNKVLNHLRKIKYVRPLIKLPRFINFDADFARLLGYYVAEGNNSAGKSVEFAFHKNETSYHKDVQNLMYKFFGLRGQIKYRDNKCEIRYRSSIIAKFLGHLCGVHATNKHIPLLCLQHKEKAVQFLRGYWAGDGHIESNEISFCTSSRQLMEELTWLLSGFNVFSKVNYRKQTNPSWAIYINGEDYNILANILNIPNRHNKFKNRPYLEKDSNYFLIKVKSVERFLPEEENQFYDISVEGKEHFVANGFVVHNSWVEAMATKTPVIMPANTAIVENITEERGFVAKSGGDPNLYTVLPHDNEVVRPLTDVNDLVEKMLFVYNNYDEALRRAENAYKWVTTELNWQGPIARRWVEIFDRAYADLTTESNLVKIEPEKPQISAEEF